MRKPSPGSTSATAESSAVVPSQGSWRDYLVLGKPLIVALLLATTWAAMVVAGGRLPDPALALWTLLGGGMTAAGASALNQYIDRDLDGRMGRTQTRPLPSGRIPPTRAFLLGAAMVLGGVVTLAALVNPLSALLAATGAVYYVAVYSILLKRATPQNIVIGGGAGAIPALVGWAAVTGSLAMPALVLFAIVFFWTPPHFWALALTRSKEYLGAGLPMLPVVYGEAATRQVILLYAIQLVAVTLLLPGLGMMGLFFFLAAAVLGSLFVWRAWTLFKRGGRRHAWALYRYSSVYLALLFAAMVGDVILIGGPRG
ncbi:MAG TPA: heme o synthase [Anaerolineales bacterium]|nr:heme o synthase [Anaerolineales bacterium]